MKESFVKYLFVNIFFRTRNMIRSESGESPHSIQRLIENPPILPPPVENLEIEGHACEPRAVHVYAQGYSGWLLFRSLDKEHLINIPNDKG